MSLPANTELTSSVCCGTEVLPLGETSVMGILNITPNSFSDGGELFSAGKILLDRVLVRAEVMVAAGVRLLDVGGESTRPGAAPVSEAEEQDRVLPVVSALRARFRTIVSVDTSRPSLMREAAKAGAGMINDVRALQTPGALEAAAEIGLPVVLVHMQGQPANMQRQPQYQAVVTEVRGFLAARQAAAISAGISARNIILDPGIGFGKTLEHNLCLIAHMRQLHALGCPLLLGASRKSMLGTLTGQSEKNRLAASIAVALAGIHQNVQIIRVHDVPETMDAIKTWQAIHRHR